MSMKNKKIDVENEQYVENDINWDDFIEYNVRDEDDDESDYGGIESDIDENDENDLLDEQSPPKKRSW